MEGSTMHRILIVDDELTNRCLLRAMLEDEASVVLEAASGIEALEIAQRSAPDLVLLDVMMPRMDGFETTRRLKQEVGDLFLPVVLVTALSDRESRLRGLEAGADDFLTKPIDPIELRTRIRNLVTLRDRELRLRERNLDLLELIRFRDELSSLLIHDLKSPIAVVHMCLSHLGDRISADPDSLEALSDARMSIERANRIVENMLDLVRMESRRLVLHRSPARPADLLSSVAEARAPMVRNRTVRLDLQVDRELQVSADVDLLTRVIENVVDNSLRFVPIGGRIVMKAEANGEVASITIGNDGPSIPRAMRESIFEKYTRGESAGRTNHGLGLYFCRLAMEAHGGRIWVKDEPLPAVFCMELPLAPTYRLPEPRIQ
jgi:two-component system sensor histidine kinase/response regulator